LTKTDKLFLKYYLNSDIIQTQIFREIGVGGGVPKLALHRIESILLTLPPLPQQKK
jgi:type I restriction enzyme S subunit